MQPCELLPHHASLLERARPGVRAFVRMLCHAEAEPHDLCMFVLDLRAPIGRVAGAELLGVPWVEQRLRRDAFPIVVFPLSGNSDIVTMVELVAPSLVGRRSTVPVGMVQVVLLDQEGSASSVLLDPKELLRGCG
jgi:hypothetical protein